MPIIYASTDDGYVGAINQSSWANARDATSGGSKSTVGTTSTVFTAVSKGLSRGGAITYTVYRTFMYFDTSSITSTVASATLSVRGLFANDGSVIAVKSDAFGGDGGTALANADFNNIVGYSAGSSLAGSATIYGSQILTTSWSTSGYNNFTATSDLLTDMKNNNVVIICFMDYTNDYLNVGVSGGFLNTGAYTANYGGTSRDPKIDYTLAPTGYGNAVNGIAAASIGKINGVATASIEKVNGI
jgi:hypothetical protein